MNCIHPRTSASICKGFGIGAVVVGTLALAVLALALAIIFAPPFGAALVNIAVATYIAIGSGATVALTVAAAVALLKKASLFSKLASLFSTMPTDFDDIEKLAKAKNFDKLQSNLDITKSTVLKKINNPDHQFDRWFKEFATKESIDEMDDYLEQIVSQYANTANGSDTIDFRSSFIEWFFIRSIITGKLQPLIYNNILPKLMKLNLNALLPEKGYKIFEKLYNISRELNS